MPKLLPPEPVVPKVFPTVLVPEPVVPKVFPTVLVPKPGPVGPKPPA